MTRSYLMTPAMHGFASLKAWLSDLPDQVMGFPAAICETGELYAEFKEFAIARPNDVEIIERRVAEAMASKLARYLENKSGRIYWRTPFESEISPDSVVARYDENGPDQELFSGRKCVLDKNWVRISCYCRLYRATLSCGEMWDWAAQQKEKAAA